MNEVMMMSYVSLVSHAFAHSRPEKQLVFVGLEQKSNAGIPDEDLKEEFL